MKKEETKSLCEKAEEERYRKLRVSSLPLKSEYSHEEHPDFLEEDLLIYG